MARRTIYYTRIITYTRVDATARTLTGPTRARRALRTYAAAGDAHGNAAAASIPFSARNIITSNAEPTAAPRSRAPGSRALLVVVGRLGEETRRSKKKLRKKKKKTEKKTTKKKTETETENIVKKSTPPPHSRVQCTRRGGAPMAERLSLSYYRPNPLINSRRKRENWVIYQNALGPSRRRRRRC